MSNDLSNQLRSLNTFEWMARPATTKQICFDAADRIEKLEAALNCNLPDYDPKIGIVERLRQLGNWRVDGTKSSPIYNKSADHIEKLEAALREIIEGQWHLSIYWAADVAKDALAGEKMDG
jgi:hypothetical protein